MNPDNAQIIDRMELADEIASYIMDDKYPDGWMENEIRGDERSTLRPKPEHETEYGDMYADVEDLIEKSNVPLKVDWESLVKQKAQMIYLRAHFAKNSKQRKAMTGVIHLIDHIQDLFEPKPEEN